MILKKLFLIILVSISIFFSNSIDGFAGNNCDYIEGDPKTSITNCLSDSPTVNSNEDLALEGTAFSGKIDSLLTNISIFLGILAVGSIVLGGIMMTLSLGEEEKIKKGKDMAKWGILGFLGVITASSIIKIVVQTIYNI